MRSVSAGELSTILGTRKRDWAFLEVRDDDGAWNNLTAESGYDFFDSADWGANDPDEVVKSATFVLRRRASGVNLSPFIGASPANRLGDASFAALVREGHEIRLWTATTDGTSPLAGDFDCVFWGKIDEVDVAASRSTMTLQCRDMGVYLQNAAIETEAAYGSTAGVAAETVKQQIINATGIYGSLGTPTLVTPTSPAWMISPAFTQKRMSVMDAMTEIDRQIGWITRYEWNGNTPELRFFRPTEKGVSDVTISASHYNSINELKTSDAEIKNVIRVSYVDGSTGSSAFVTSVDAASVTKYGRRYMEIGEGDTSLINSAAEAQRLADAARDDLSTPMATHKIDMPYFWPVELGDRHTYAANGEHYDSDQHLYVISYRHSLADGKGRTTITARGKPVARYRDWLDVGVTDEALVTLSTLDVVATEFATTYSIAWGGLGTITLSIDGGAFATPPASPIVVTRNPENGATKIYRFKSIRGEDETIETIYVLPIGAVAPPPDLKLTPSAPLTLTQSFVVTCVNPRAGGATPVITVFALGASGTATKPDTTTVPIPSDGTEIIVPSGTTLAMTRPAVGSASGSLVVQGRITGGGLAEIQRTIIARLASSPNLNIVATPFASTYSIAWSGSNVSLSIDGAAFVSAPTAPLNATPIIVNRPAIGQPDKVYTFRGTIDDRETTNTITIPAIGSPETPNLEVKQESQSDTQIAFRVTATSPVSGIVPSIVGYLTDATFASAHSNGGPITSNDVVTINRPAFASKRDGIFRVRASIGSSYEEAINDIPPQVQTSFGPTLEVLPSPFATTYSLYYSGDGVLVDKRDGNGFVNPGGSPLIVNRPSVGSADLVYTFRATKDGQEVTNSVTIPAIGAADTPNLSVLAAASTTAIDFTVTFNSPAGGSTTAIVDVTDCTILSAHWDGGPVSSGDIVTIQKPAFGQKAGSVRFRATNGSSYEEVSRTVVTQIKTEFGPTLDMAITPSATQYSIAFNAPGSVVEYSLDGSGHSPATSPIIVVRNAAGGADKVLTLFATKDGQMISDSVTVPAIDVVLPPALKTARLVSVNDNGSGFNDDYNVVWTLQGDANDTEYRININMYRKATAADYFAYRGNSSGHTPSSLSATINDPAGDGISQQHYCVVTLYRNSDGTAVNSIQTRIVNSTI